MLLSHILKIYSVAFPFMQLAVFGRLTKKPESRNATQGQTVVLECSTSTQSSVDWEFLKTLNERNVNIFTGNSNGGGRIGNDYIGRSRYRVEQDTRRASYNLVIGNVTKWDSGFYKCTDVNEPESYGIATLSVSEDIPTQLYSDGIAVVKGYRVELVFATTQTQSIQLEHRSLDRSYPLHVFRYGRIVNDYYVISNRFSVNTSKAGSWILIIENVQPSDAGRYIFSENNDLGKQCSAELIVMEGDISIETDGNCQWTNVTCAVNFTGRIPPNLDLKQVLHSSGKIERLKSISTVSGSSAILHSNVSASDLIRCKELFCLVESTPSYNNYSYKSVSNYSCEFCAEDDSRRRTNFERRVNAIMVFSLSSAAVLFVTVVFIVAVLVLNRRRRETGSR